MAKVILSEEQIDEYWSFLQPSRPAMLTTLNKDGTINVAPFGWNMPVSANPPRVSVALVNSPPNRTLTNIRREKEFVLNIPTMQVADKLVQASYQHPSDVSKFSVIGFQRLESRVIQTPGIAECRASLECRLFKEVDVGDHTLILGDVKVVSFEEEDYTKDLTLKIDQAWPVIHLDQYRKNGGQVHSFVKTAGLHNIFVPYNDR
ncbi:flavin reductase family protein [Alkalihalobacterium alkalinitrilicum]|uniref:flavin reductase family protein n=1 Tax=Alkalihalobacterium alkalinitrilicum TaxID=427920 RepID=UPI000995599E|nr:flavin reductase family protein [Alkalihalobacterium alkalinitrilicum]